MNQHVAAAVVVVSFIAGVLTPVPERPRLSAQLPPPPNSNPPPRPAIECDLKASPDYVEGIDARGREVAPADVPAGQEVEIDTEVFAEVRSKNPQLRGAGVVVNLPGLGAPACVPLGNKSPP